MDNNTSKCSFPKYIITDCSWKSFFRSKGILSVFCSIVFFLSQPTTLFAETENPKISLLADWLVVNFEEVLWQGDYEQAESLTDFTLTQGSVNSAYLYDADLWEINAKILNVSGEIIQTKLPELSTVTTPYVRRIVKNHSEDLGTLVLGYVPGDNEDLHILDQDSELKYIMELLAFSTMRQLWNFDKEAIDSTLKWVVGDPQIRRRIMLEAAVVRDEQGLIYAGLGHDEFGKLREIKTGSDLPFSVNVLQNKLTYQGKSIGSLHFHYSSQ